MSDLKYQVNGPHFDWTNTAVGSTVEVIGDTGVFVLKAGDEAKINATITNTGATLTDFQLQTKNHPDDDWATELSGTDWATATSTLLRASSGLNTLASGSVGSVTVDLHAAYSFRFRASCGTSTSVTVRGTVAIED